MVWENRIKRKKRIHAGSAGEPVIFATVGFIGEELRGARGLGEATAFRGLLGACCRKIRAVAVTIAVVLSDFGNTWPEED